MWILAFSCVHVHFVVEVVVVVVIVVVVVGVGVGVEVVVGDNVDRHVEGDQEKWQKTER